MSKEEKEALKWAAPLWIGAMTLGFIGGFLAGGWREGVQWAALAFVIIFVPTMVQVVAQR